MVAHHKGSYVNITYSYVYLKQAQLSAFSQTSSS